MTRPLPGLLARPRLHVAVDMQRLFAEPTAWHTPALTDILPEVIRLVRHAPACTVLTRFAPARRAEDACGAEVPAAWPAPGGGARAGQ